MAGELVKFEFGKFMQREVAEIIEAWQRQVLIWGTKDIDAAGDEVEQAVRRVLRRKVPVGYYVGNGHIVDSQLMTSPQLDIIISDNTSAPILFKTENGTEYFPYESVYAIGEVKATFDKNRGYIEKFSKVVTKIKTELKRNSTRQDSTDYGNPLFSFMLFAHSEDYNYNRDDFGELIKKIPIEELPDVVCLIDTGVLFLLPYTVHRHCFFARRGYPETKRGANFADLYGRILQHLTLCKLETPDLNDYLLRSFPAWKADDTISYADLIFSKLNQEKE